MHNTFTKAALLVLQRFATTVARAASSAGTGVVVLAAILSPLALAEVGPAAAIPLEDGGAPRLEIRNYRFQAHRGQGFERLVLEFSRKDSNSGSQPTVKVTPAGGGEMDVTIGHAILMGAIPESLINDSYQSKSRYLGGLSVNADNPAAGFSLRTALKSQSAKLTAFWLANPPRLVIDARTARHLASRESSSEGTLPVIHRRPAPSAFDKFICFPANAKVGMNVVFQTTHSKTEEELKNVHVNLQGTSVQEEAPPPADAIVCYPRDKQVIAQLGFEAAAPAASEALNGNAAAPAAQPAGAERNALPAVAGATDDSDMTLNPDPDGAQRAPGSAAPKPALLPPPPAANPETTKKAPAPTSPASLLPPLK